MMVKPLVPEIPTSAVSPVSPSTNARKNVQFSHFGVMNTGHQGSGAFLTSLVVNLALAFVVIVISASLSRTIQEHNRVLATLTLPVQVKPVEPIKPKVLPKPPVVKMEPPKIKLPEMVKPPEALKPVAVAMPQPAPVVIPAPPKKMIAPAAPQVVSLAHPQAASLPNNSPKPTAVALGRPDSPIPTNVNRPATASVDLGQKGMPGMTASNTGAGPAAAKVNLGSGQPDSQSMTGNGVRKVLGVRLGSPNGTGPPNGTGQTVGQVNLGRTDPPATPQAAQARSLSAEKPPKVLAKPTPVYTAEATAQRISGAVTIKIRVSSSGSVSIVQLVNGLGHGLDESAKNAILATKFSPATDATGHPVDWEGVVRVDFQLSGS